MVPTKKDFVNNEPPSLTLKSLPQEILEKCLSFLDPKDICLGVECVSKAFRNVSKESRLVWKHIALRIYGEDIVIEAMRIYQNESFKDMVVDDMRLVAIPTISMEDDPIPCFWRSNFVRLFYVCLVVGIQYHRPSDEVRIFIHVRGERDLRHPNTSSITRSNDESTPGLRPVLKAKGFNGISYGPGHYQGYISFKASFFDREGDYTFLYADPRMGNLHWPPDYKVVSVMNIVPETRVSGKATRNDVASFFRRALSCKSVGPRNALHVLDGWSPFFTDESDDDAKAAAELQELERFRHFVDHSVFTRHQSRNYRKWWVERRTGNAQPFNGDSGIYEDFVNSLV